MLRVHSVTTLKSPNITTSAVRVVDDTEMHAKNLDVERMEKTENYSYSVSLEPFLYLHLQKVIITSSRLRSMSPSVAKSGNTAKSHMCNINRTSYYKQGGLIKL
jgi:hypothetical protein